MHFFLLAITQITTTTVKPLSEDRLKQATKKWCLSVATRLQSDREAVINSCGHEHQHSSVITVACCPPTLPRLRDNIIVIVHTDASPRLSADLKQRLSSFTKVESLDAKQNLI